MALRVGGKLADAQEAIEVGAVGKRFGVAKLAHVAALLVKDDYQVRFVQCGDRNLAIRERGDGQWRVYLCQSRVSSGVPDFYGVRRAVGDVDRPGGIHIHAFAEADRAELS
jgi:hypothetical protein